MTAVSQTAYLCQQHFAIYKANRTRLDIFLQKKILVKMINMLVWDIIDRVGFDGAQFWHFWPGNTGGLHFQRQIARDFPYVSNSSRKERDSGERWIYGSEKGWCTIGSTNVDPGCWNGHKLVLPTELQVCDILLRPVLLQASRVWISLWKHWKKK